MMKQYHIYVFTQDGCAPCDIVKTHVSMLTEQEQSEVDFVPFRAPNGQLTALAEQLNVQKTPTLVVVHETVQCDYSPEDGYEFCDLQEESVERFVGGKSIIEHLNATLDAYTYAHPE